MKGVSDSSGLLRLAIPPSIPGSFGSPVLKYVLLTFIAKITEYPYKTLTGKLE
jgi:hypothetical protein